MAESKFVYRREGENMGDYNTRLYNHIEELELYKSEHERLKRELDLILHPNDDGPPKPSFCDLVAYVRGDLRRAKAEREWLINELSEGIFEHSMESKEGAEKWIRNTLSKLEDKDGKI